MILVGMPVFQTDHIEYSNIESLAIYGNVAHYYTFIEHHKAGYRITFMAAADR